jgi:glycosyltransferase involved in cell wall biosynthesis
MILIVSAVFLPEPVVAARISYDLAMALSEKHDVTVLSPRPSRPFGFTFPEKSLHETRFEHIVMKSYTYPKSSISGRFRESFSFGKEVVKYIDIHHRRIEGLYLASWPLIAQHMIIKAALKYHIKSVVHVQDLYPESLSNKIPYLGKLINLFLMPLDKKSLIHASLIVTNSDKLKLLLESSRKIPAEKIQVVKNWQDEEAFFSTEETPAEEPREKSHPRLFTFMYLGNIGPVAGVDFLMRSFIQADLENSQLIIAGSGSQRGKCMQIKEELHSERVIFMDVPAGKVSQIQDEANAFLLPIKKGASISSIPSKLPSYMFSKKPIIACVDNESDIAVSIRESGCGWVVPSEDSGSLIRAMNEAISCQETTLRELGQKGYTYAMKNYSKKNNLSLLVSAILQTINS